MSTFYIETILPTIEMFTQKIEEKILFNDIISFKRIGKNPPFRFNSEKNFLFFKPTCAFPDPALSGDEKRGERRKFISNGRYEDHSLEKDGFALTRGTVCKFFGWWFQFVLGNVHPETWGKMKMGGKHLANIC